MHDLNLQKKGLVSISGIHFTCYFSVILYTIHSLFCLFFSYQPHFFTRPWLPPLVSVPAPEILSQFSYLYLCYKTWTAVLNFVSQHLSWLSLPAHFKSFSRHSWLPVSVCSFKLLTQKNHCFWLEAVRLSVICLENHYCLFLLLEYSVHFSLFHRALYRDNKCAYEI